MVPVVLSIRGNTFLAYGVPDLTKWIPDDVPIPDPGEAILIMSSSVWWDKLLRVFRYTGGKGDRIPVGVTPGERPYLVVHHDPVKGIQVKTSLHSVAMISMEVDTFMHILGAEKANTDG